MARKRIGELLLEQGVISRHQLEAALMFQKQTRARLGITLISQGFISEDALVAALSQALGVPRVDLKTLTPDWSAVHMLRPRFCEQTEVFPYGFAPHSGSARPQVEDIAPRGAQGFEKLGARRALLVAMADPLNGPAVQQIEFTTGLPVSPRIASLSEVRAAILRYYHKVDPDAAGEGKLAIHAVPTEPDEPMVVLGQELPPEAPPKKKKGSSVAQDLDYLFGEGDELSKLDQKFWALMRVLARKGLVTKDEFRQELEEGED